MAVLIAIGFGIGFTLLMGLAPEVGLVICGVIVFGYIGCLVVGGVQAVFMTPVAPEYDSDGKIDNEWRYVNKGRWT